MILRDEHQEVVRTVRQRDKAWRCGCDRQLQHASHSCIRSWLLYHPGRPCRTFLPGFKEAVCSLWAAWRFSDRNDAVWLPTDYIWISCSNYILLLFTRRIIWYRCKNWKDNSSLWCGVAYRHCRECRVLTEDRQYRILCRIVVLRCLLAQLYLSYSAAYAIAWSSDVRILKFSGLQSAHHWPGRRSSLRRTRALTKQTNVSVS